MDAAYFEVISYLEISRIKNFGSEIKRNPRKAFRQRLSKLFQKVQRKKSL
jgi:hypothetical protein